MRRTRFPAHCEEVHLISLELVGPSRDPRAVSPRLLDRLFVSLKRFGLSFEAIGVNNSSTVATGRQTSCGTRRRPNRTQSHHFPSEFRSNCDADGSHGSR